MSITKALAREIAQRKNLSEDWEMLRDQVDTATFSELDCFQLDMLTDWVRKEANGKVL